MATILLVEDDELRGKATKDYLWNWFCLILFCPVSAVICVNSFNSQEIK